MRALLETREIHLGASLKRLHCRTYTENSKKLWHVCETVSDRKADVLKQGKSVHFGTNSQRWSHPVTTEFHRFCQCWRLSNTVLTVSKLENCDWPDMLTVENTENIEKHTVTSKRTSWTTEKKKKEVYLQTWVRDTHKPGRPKLTNNINRRFTHIIQGYYHTQLPRRLNTDIPDINRTNRLRTVFMTTVVSPFENTRVKRQKLSWFTHVQYDPHILDYDR